MALRYSPNDLSKIKNRTFFFDTNILFYLYYPVIGKWQVEVYSKLFKDLLGYKSKLFIDSFIISEFINRALRIEYKNFMEATGSAIDFKPYRNSVDGQNSANGIFLIVKNILNQFNIEGCNLSIQEIDSLLTVDSLDFNDKIIERHCLQKKYVLVTDDSDFKNSSAEILTANRNLRIR